MRLSLALVIGLVPIVAHAEDSWQQALKPAARDKVDEALRNYSVQRYQEASELFRAAYLDDPAPKLLFSLGQALRLAGRCGEAVEAYRSFLRTAPDPEARQRAERGIERCPLPSPVSEPAIGRVADPSPSVVSAPPRLAPPWYTDVIGDSLLGGALVAATFTTVFVVRERLEVGDLESHARYGAYTAATRRAESARRGWLISGSAAVLLTSGALGRYLWREP